MVKKILESYFFAKNEKDCVDIDFEFRKLNTHKWYPERDGIVQIKNEKIEIKNCIISNHKIQTNKVKMHF